MRTQLSAMVAVLVSVVPGPSAFAGDLARSLSRAAAEIAADGSGALLTAPARSRVFLPISGRPTTRPAVLPGLYASLAALQVFDGCSTTRALAHGAHEANPMMQDVVGNPALFWSIKTATTVAPMMAAERLWKTNKAGAIALMVASNAVMAAVAAHNTTVLRHQR